MKRILLLVACFLGIAQVSSAFDPPRMHPTDRFIVTVFSDIWQNVPERMDKKAIQRGMSFKAMQDMPWGRSSFSLATGIGFTSNNLYSDHYFGYTPNGHYDFYRLSGDYDKNKLSLNYLDVPVQIRYRTRNLERNFRIYVGLKASYLVNAHTKYYGKASSVTNIYFDTPFSPGSRSIKIKEHKLENINKHKISMTGMLGVGSVNIYLSYALTSIFEDNQSEDMFPISLGVSVILF